MTKNMWTAAAAVLVAVSLGACSSTEDVPEPPAAEPATAAPVAKETTAPPPESVDVRVIVRDSATGFLAPTGEECSSETFDGNPLSAVALGPTGNAVEIRLPVVPGTYDESDRLCTVDLVIEAQPLVETTPPALFIRDGSPRALVNGGFDALRPTDTHKHTLYFDIEPRGLEARGITPPAQDAPVEAAVPAAEVAFLADLEAAGVWYEEGSAVSLAESYCENLTDHYASNSDGAIAAMIENRAGVEELIRTTHYCPEFTDEVEVAITGFYNGSHAVRENADPEAAGPTEIRPGTYRTLSPFGMVRDCYWERSSGSGSIIDNGFVTAAPDGVTVTVRAGEAFTSERCGAWVPVN